MKAVVAAFNQEKALVGAFSVITNLRMELFEALVQREPGKHCQNNLGIWCIVWTGKMCVMCSVKCRNSCHPRWRIGSIWRWHPAMSLWHIYYVLFTFYSLEQFYFSSPRHVSIFFFSPPRLDVSFYILCIFWSRDASDCPQLQMQCLLMVNILLR